MEVSPWKMREEVKWGPLRRGVRWLAEFEVSSAKTEVRDCYKKKSNINKSAKITGYLKYLMLPRS